MLYLSTSFKNQHHDYLQYGTLFQLKGITKPFTYLLHLGYSGGYATKLTNNRVEQINLQQLERFCRDFNCTPNDVFDFRPGAKDSLPSDHALHTLTKPVISEEIIGKINALPADKIQQIHDIIKNMS